MTLDSLQDCWGAEQFHQLEQSGDSYHKNTADPPPYDALLVKSLKQLCSANDPPILKEARSASYHKDYARALKLYQACLGKLPLSASDELNLGWTIYFVNKEYLRQPQRNFALIDANLKCYLSLPKIEKPSLLHSSILKQADKLTKGPFMYVEFLQIFALDKLREEDFKPTTGSKPGPDGKLPVFAHLYEMVLHHAAKNTLQRMTQGQRIYLPALNDFLQRVDKELEHDTASDTRLSDMRLWLYYDAAKINLRLQRFKPGLAQALMVVKQKLTEYWAWQLLGRLYVNVDLNLAICAFCRALSLKPPPFPSAYIANCSRP